VLISWNLVVFSISYSNTRLEMPNMFIAEENRKDNERLQMVWI